MRGFFVRVAVLALLAPMALGGAFSHVEGSEVLSHGTHLFPPDHPAHAPFVPEREHACASCAVSNLTPPASAPVFLEPPSVRPLFESRVETRAFEPDLPELPGRSPPSAA